MNHQEHRDPCRDLFLYEFDRQAVKERDLSLFMAHWGIDRLGTGSALRDRLDCLAFFLNGHDQDSRPLYGIPEVRAFYRHLWRSWPFWFYFCCLDLPNLATMTYCCLDSLSLILSDSAPVVHVRIDPRELADFVRAGWAPMNFVFERASLSEEENRRRSRAVADYYRKDWGTWLGGHGSKGH